VTDVKNFIQSIGNLNIPNALTTLRLSLIPVFVVAFYLPIYSTRTLAAAIFFIAGFTDYLDGYLARYLQQASSLGAFLDPVADKLLVTTALVLLAADPQLPYVTIPAAIIIGREIAISALREWLAKLGQGTRMRVHVSGKIKTFFQMLAIFFLILSNPSVPETRYAQWFGYICLYIAGALTLYSMWFYLQAAYNSVQLEQTDV
jgi:CDP-diacylglycerol---glycerol-3-phosphate 3-phosphatidyltransferase